MPTASWRWKDYIRSHVPQKPSCREEQEVVHFQPGGDEDQYDETEGSFTEPIATKKSIAYVVTQKMLHCGKDYAKYAVQAVFANLNDANNEAIRRFNKACDTMDEYGNIYYNDLNGLIKGVEESGCLRFCIQYSGFGGQLTVTVEKLGVKVESGKPADKFPDYDSQEYVEEDYSHEEDSDDGNCRYDGEPPLGDADVEMKDVTKDTEVGSG